MTRKLKNKYGPWVTGEDFFNRDAEIALLIQNIGSGGNHILIVAPRRVGKTSLIRETFRRLGQNATHYLIFLDIQNCATPEDVMVAMSMGASHYRTLKKKVTDVFSTFLKQLSETIETIGAPDLLEIKLREGIKGDWQFKGRQLLSNLAEADRPIVICMDELPIMVSRLLKKSSEEAEIFLSWLRQVMGQFQEKICFIICGSIGLEPILKRYGLSHTIGHLQPFHIDPWDRQTAGKCLNLLARTCGIDWSAELSTKMADLLGVCIPHHVQMFFGYLYQDLFKDDRRNPNTEDIERVYQESMLSTRGHAELADYEERLLRVLDKEKIPLALDLLSEAAIKEALQTTMCDVLFDRSGLKDKGPVLREVMDVLEHDGYLVRHESIDGWRFSSNLIRDWWKKRFSQSYVNPSDHGDQNI
jgi:uncharacterized protein